MTQTGIETLATPIERRDLAASVADKISSMIVEQGITVGEAIEPVVTLSKRLGVSRTVVREAVSRLMADGVIGSEHGRRWRVLRQPQVAPSDPSFEPASDDLDHQSLADQVAEAVLSMILTENYEEGDPLPPGRELADRFGVSIVVVREALTSLSARGLLNRRRGREPSVSLPEYRILSSILEVRAHLEHIPLREFQDCRELFELEAVRLASRHAMPKDHLRLRELVLAMRRAESPEDLIPNDLEFHLEIARLSGNRAIELMFRTLNDVIRSQMLSSYDAVRGRAGRHGTDRSIAIHEKVLEAIEARNEIAAVAAMREHFDLYDNLD